MIGTVRIGRIACVLLMLLGLGACGGGGGGSSDSALYPEFSEDVLPSGARVDVSGQNLFALAAGDQWQYERQVNGVASGTVSRTVSASSAGRVLVAESNSATGENTSGLYEIAADGLHALDPMEAAAGAPGLYAALPQVLEYATPLYAQGAERRVVRQGNLKADIDGDGKDDYYRVEFRQVFRGFETLTVLGRSVQVAHFSNTLAMTLRLTRAPTAAQTVTGTEEAFFAPGMGLVLADRRVDSSVPAASVAPYRLVLSSALVGGVSYSSASTVTPPATDGQGNGAVTLTHADLVYDPLRGRYYASVPSSVVGEANRIASIDAGSGAVSLSASAVGSNPGPMAISADGSTLYVGLTGSGELLRLSLPGMVETGRVALPRDSFFGQYTAEQISVSPLDARVVAVSLARSSVSPRHGGVALVRDMVLQPQRTQEHTGSNRIGFDASGAWVIGYNNETSEFGLRRLEVLADGLIERQVVATAGAYSIDIDVSSGLAMVGGQAYQPDTLALRGTVASSLNKCVLLRGTAKVACVGWLDSTLRVADTSTFSLLAQPAYPALTSGVTPRLVAGPAGQVAIFDGSVIRRVSLPVLQ